MLASDELRDHVLSAMTDARGNRERAAEMMGVSLRTLNRYISRLDLFAELDKRGPIKHAGPPRNQDRGSSNRKGVVLDYVKKHGSDFDYGELTMLLYGQDTPLARGRLYTTLTEYKGKGYIATDGVRWFVL